MPYRALAAEILAKWRTAERERNAVEGTPEAARLEDEMLRLRREYVAAVDAARKAHLPEPASWPRDATMVRSVEQSSIGTTPPASDVFTDRTGPLGADGGLEAVYGRLASAIGETEADAIFSEAKARVGGAPLDSWLQAVDEIARERHPNL